MVHAQDTYKCPDGWRKWESDRNGECRCFFYSSREMVTKDDADVLCEAGHPGSWVAEIDYPCKYNQQSRLKSHESKILERTVNL